MFFRCFALICLASYAIYLFHIRILPPDITSHRKLTQESRELRHRHALEDKPAHQKRQGVLKDIWSQDETRHFQIQSDHSDLLLSQRKDKIEAVEELQNIRCSIKDDFILTADEGLYTFLSHQFIAKKNCHLVQADNQIDGTCIYLDLDQEIVTYDNPKGRLSTGILFTADKLIWYKNQNRLHLTNNVTIEQPDQFTLHSNQGTLTLNEFKPMLLKLEGNVQLVSSRIQDKLSYAIADTLTYNPIDKTLLFSSPRKVLFWQQGLSLSATQVLIRQDQSIEGHGDVHFAFDLEEQNSIEKLFKQYL